LSLCDQPIHITSVKWGARRGGWIGEFVFQCPREECKRLFIARYYGTHNTQGQRVDAQFHSVGPTTPTSPPLPDLVAELSPGFAEVYKQAAAAEAFELADIAGCGYRRALEFLVKDYSISMHPSKAEAIKKKFLGAVISDDIDNPTIQKCARRATWLGNDETHYIRKWETKDINDLKSLIALTAGWISAHLLTSKYEADMPESSH
jgi:hypothetical protein